MRGWAKGATLHVLNACTARRLDHRDGARVGQIDLQNRFGTKYVDKGMPAYESRYRQQRLKWLSKQAALLNLQLIPVSEVTG